jgi:hypothetical protein
MIHHVDEAEERLVTVVERARFDVGQYRFDQRSIAEKFRRNCGVRLDSKRTGVAP